MPVMLCTEATFVKKNSSLVATMVSVDTVGLQAFTFRILEPYPTKDILVSMELLQYPSLHKKIFSLRISSVNVTKAAVSRGLGQIYWGNP